MKKVLTVFLAVILVTAMFTGAFTASAALEVVYDKDFGSTPYDGMATSPTVAFTVDKAYGNDYTLEANIKINSVVNADGRGVKFILRSCSAASSGDLEVWLGYSAIWACTTEWKGHTT